MDFGTNEVTAEIVVSALSGQSDQEEHGDNLLLVRKGWDGLHVTIVPKDQLGPVPTSPDYLAPVRMDFRFSGADAKWDRRLETRDGARGVTGIHLHVQVTDRRTNLRLGWKSRIFRRPMQTLEALFRRAAGIPPHLEDTLAYIAEDGFAGIQMHHHLNGDCWEHCLDWDNRDRLPELPDEARIFLEAIFGRVPREIESGFLLGTPDVIPARDELSIAFQALHSEALKAEAMLRFLREEIKGQRKLALDPWEWM